jgi:Domain of unknown function (DUF4276)
MTKKKKIKAIGLIVEDNSDFFSIKTLISRIVEKDNLTFKKAIGNGCGKMKRKALSYANNLSQKGCDLVILVHDLDRNKHIELQKELETLMKSSNAKNTFVCIPIEEIEGWFLSDLKGIKESFQLDRIPKITGNPETIKSPKEKLEDIVLHYSNKSKVYLNTKHNNLLSNKICLDKMKKKCQSFSSLYDFVIGYEY